MLVGFIFLTTSPLYWVASPDTAGKIATSVVASLGALIILASILL
jgi:hypothetical protein